MNIDMQELIDRKIIKVEMDGDEILVFTDSEGNKIAYETFGDCCSYSWFAHVTGLKNLLNQVVTEVTERQEFSEEDQKRAEAEGDYDCLALYGYIIKTKKGTCDIEFRNDSNGYYG